MYFPVCSLYRSPPTAHPTATHTVTSFDFPFLIVDLKYSCKIIVQLCTFLCSDTWIQDPLFNHACLTLKFLLLVNGTLWCSVKP